MSAILNVPELTHYTFCPACRERIETTVDALGVGIDCPVCGIHFVPQNIKPFSAEEFKLPPTEKSASKSLHESGRSLLFLALLSWLVAIISFMWSFRDQVQPLPPLICASFFFVIGWALIFLGQFYHIRAALDRIAGISRQK
jgi:hypothetical protein